MHACLGLLASEIRVASCSKTGSIYRPESVGSAYPDTAIARAAKLGEQLPPGTVCAEEIGGCGELGTGMPHASRSTWCHTHLQASSLAHNSQAAGEAVMSHLTHGNSLHAKVICAAFLAGAPPQIVRWAALGRKPSV